MFAVPLNPFELCQLGAIAVVWGQLDYMLDEILAHAHAFDMHQRKQFLTDKMMATKVEMLSKDLDRLPESLHERARALVVAINAAKPDRNCAFHGVWGWHVSKRKQTREVAAFHSRRENNPLKPIQLRKLLEQLVAASKLAGEIMCDLLGFQHSFGNQFCWGGGSAEGEPPAWLAKAHGEPRKGRAPWERKK
jgi:hypothetical protein